MKTNRDRFCLKIIGFCLENLTFFVCYVTVLFCSIAFHINYIFFCLNRGCIYDQAIVRVTLDLNSWSEERWQEVRRPNSVHFLLKLGHKGSIRAITAALWDKKENWSIPKDSATSGLLVLNSVIYKINSQNQQSFELNKFGPS